MSSRDAESQPEELPSQVIRGFRFPPATFRFTRENIESILNYQLLDDDIVLSTYPKAGTTWSIYIIWEILNDGKPIPDMDEMRKVVPYMERMGAKFIENLPSPRTLMCHLPFNLTPKNPRTKYIYMVRNPCDVVVSYYYFLKKIQQKQTNFDFFFDKFLSGDLPYGDYLDHALSWYREKDNPNILILSYDHMIKDPRGGLLRVAAFLGENYLKKLTSDEALVERIVEHTSFNFMKKNLSEDSAKKPKDSSELKNAPKNADFFRKGTRGDGKNLMSEDQTERMQAKIAEALKDTDMEKLWNF